jgi:hypothetical protein
MDLLKRIQLAWLRRREFLKAQAELESHSQRELATDLRMNWSDIPDLAAKMAQERVDAFVRSHPKYRRAWRWRERRKFVPGWP